MKITYFIIILALISLKNSIESIDSENFCKKIKNENCLKYDCGTELCSIDKKSCNHFNVWKNIMKKYLKKDNHRTKYNKFVKSIKRCSMIQIDGLNSANNYCKKANKNMECEIYSCGENYCSISKKSCVYLISFKSLMKGYIKQDLKQKKFQNFINSIEICEPNGQIDFKNQWSHRLNFG
jgi:hypothetical protein